MNSIKQLIYFTLTFLLIITTSSAEVPHIINYQGQTSVDCGGDNLCNVAARIYTTVEDGTLLWEETYTDVPISAQGVFNVLLGSGTAGSPHPDLPDLFTGEERWLEITIEAFTFSPRVALASMPYSFKQETVDGATGGSITDVIRICNNDNYATTGGGLELAYNPAINKGYIQPYDRDLFEYGELYLGTESASIGSWTNIGRLHVPCASSEYGGISLYVSGGARDIAYPAGQNLQIGTWHNTNQEYTEKLVLGSEADISLLTRINGYDWPSTGAGLELAYDDSKKRGYIQTCDRDAAGDFGEIYFGVSSMSIGSGTFMGRLHVRTPETSDPEYQGIGIYSSGGSRDICWPYGEALQFGTWNQAEYDLGNEGWLKAMQVNHDGLAIDGYSRSCVVEITGGCDLAEPFEIAGNKEIPSGALVVIDAENPGKLKMSELAYDTRVAGIVSGAGGINTGLTLSQQGTFDSGQNIAIGGRAFCLADASLCSIRPGDLLTTSNIPGHAMKAVDQGRAYGAVIGKAMTSLEEGRGLVLVLVNLQ